eukprot:COSAG02_NODE_15392_length_1175_cov_1.069703_2_plen_165_part_00
MPTEVLIDYTATPWLIEAAKSSWSCTNPSPPVSIRSRKRQPRLVANAIIFERSYSIISLLSLADSDTKSPNFRYGRRHETNLGRQVASSTSLTNITFRGTQKGLQWPSANCSIAGMMRDSSARLSCIAATLGQTQCQEYRRQGSCRTAEGDISVASGSSTEGQL